MAMDPVERPPSRRPAPTNVASGPSKKRGRKPTTTAENAPKIGEADAAAREGLAPAETSPAKSDHARPAAAPPPSKPSASSPPIAPAAKAAPAPTSVDAAKTPLPNFEALSRNVALLVDESGKLAAAYFQPREAGEGKSPFADQVADAMTTFGKVAEHYISDPQRTVQAQATLSKQFVDLWTSTFHRLTGEKTEPVAPSDPADKRFADPE